jgi:hypothetical protein
MFPWTITTRLMKCPPFYLGGVRRRSVPMSCTRVATENMACAIGSRMDALALSLTVLLEYLLDQRRLWRRSPNAEGAEAC